MPWSDKKSRNQQPLAAAGSVELLQTIDRNTSSVKGGLCDHLDFTSSSSSLGTEDEGNEHSVEGGKIVNGSLSSLDPELCRSPECVGSGSVEGWGWGGLWVDAQQQELWQLQ